MNRDDAIAALKACEAELRRCGITHAGVFGSVSRGDAGPSSDIDILVRFAPEASITLWDYAGLKRQVARMLRAPLRKVDVIDLDGVSARVRPSMERDAVYAF